MVASRVATPGWVRVLTANDIVLSLPFWPAPGIVVGTGVRPGSFTLPPATRGPPVPTFPADRLVRFASQLFEARGVPADEAGVVARSLIDANLCGHDSHGIMRVAQYVKALDDGLMRTGVPLSIVRQTPAVLVCDGQWALGQVQAHRLLERLVPMAQAVGLAAGTLRH